MDVAHFEAGALAAEAARSKGRQAALVGDLREPDADDARTALVDDGLQHLPLLVSPQFGLRAAARVRVGRPCRTPGFEHAALRRAAKRDAFDARGGGRRAGRRALVEEDIDRPAARGERLGCRDRGEHGILGVLAHRHDPEVDAVLPHQRRQERVEALAQPFLLQRRLLAQRPEWACFDRGVSGVRPRRRRLRRHQARGEHGAEAEHEQHPAGQRFHMADISAICRRQVNVYKTTTGV